VFRRWSKGSPDSSHTSRSYDLQWLHGQCGWMSCHNQLSVSTGVNLSAAVSQLYSSSPSEGLVTEELSLSDRETVHQRMIRVAAHHERKGVTGTGVKWKIEPRWEELATERKEGNKDEKHTHERCKGTTVVTRTLADGGTKMLCPRSESSWDSRSSSQGPSHRDAQLATHRGSRRPPWSWRPRYGRDGSDHRVLATDLGGPGLSKPGTIPDGV